MDDSAKKPRLVSVRFKGGNRRMVAGLRAWQWLAVSAVSGLIVGACGSETTDLVSDDLAQGGSAGAGGTAAGGGTAGQGAASCLITMCQNHVYECGDCVDNDADGSRDMMDPDCLGPCDDNENGYHVGISNVAPCKQDCYFDQDTGSGNDECYWDHTCDPHEVAPGYHPEGPDCPYAPGSIVSPTGLTCEELSQTQSPTCLDTCLPLVPNGCDCFGCCELPAGSGNYVWLGSEDDKRDGTCVRGLETDPDACEPCEPVQGCLAACDECELCLGKSELPASCSGGAGGNAGEGGAGGDSCGGQVCPVGQQPCGLWCQPACPEGTFCRTGCCTNVPR